MSESPAEQWYLPQNPEEIASPALLIFVERAAANIKTLINIAGDTKRLRPHVKTHKLAPIVKMHLAQGITKVKCATLAEAEMAARAGVRDVLLAYQPVGPNQKLLVELAGRYPEVQFGCLVDNETTARQLDAAVTGSGVNLNVWIDIDNGAGRTGISPGAGAEALARQLSDSAELQFAGLHVYDGQFGHLAFDDRVKAANESFKPVRELVERLQGQDIKVDNIVAGGSPTFPVHAFQSDLDLSPGTYSLWDYGYATKLPELPFEHAAVLLTRVVSKPGGNRLCLDLGHKAVAPENPLEKRVRFLNALDVAFLDQKEEHLVIEVADSSTFAVGDVLYGIPWHICPTVALYQEAVALDGQGAIIERWPITARNRRLL